MTSYSGAFNTTSVDADEIEASDISCENLIADNITCDNLVVTGTVSLPNLQITDSEIISLSGNKIIDPLRINNIYEKTPGSKITFNNITQFLGSANIEVNTTLKVYGSVEFYDQYDTHKVNLDLMNFQELDRDCRLLFPTDISVTDEFTLSDTPARLYNKDISTGCTIVDSTTFLNDPVILKTFKFDGSGLTINNLRTMTIPNASGTLVLNDNSATLTNKSIDGLTNTLTNIQDSSLSTNVLTTTNTKTVTNKTIDFASNTVSNLPDSALSTNVLTTTNTKTLTNKTISGASNTLTNINASSVGSSGLVSNSNYDYLRYLDQYLATTSAPTFNALTITYPNPLYCEQMTRMSGANGTSINITPNASYNYFFYTPAISSNGSDYLVATNNTQTLTNKTMSSMAFSGTHTGTYTASGVHNITNTTDASSSTTGSLVLSGGLGVAKDIYIANGRNLNASNLNSPSGTFYINGGTKLRCYNTTNSTSKTSSASIYTEGGLSVAKDIYCDYIYGNNKLTDYYVILLEYQAVQTFANGVDEYFAFNTVIRNPSGMTTYLNTGLDDGFTLNQTGHWLITFHTYIAVTDSNPAYCNIYLTRVGTSYDEIISQSITSYSGGNNGAGISLSWSDMRYYYSGQRLAVDMNAHCTPATVDAGYRWNDGQITRFSAQWMGS